MLETIPKGPNKNVYFLVKNKENIHRRANGLQSCFVDDCGAWIGASGASPISFYIRLSSGHIKNVS